MKNLFILFLVLINFLMYSNALAGIPQSSDDSTSMALIKPLELTEINYEMNKAEKQFMKMELSLEPTSRMLEIDTLFVEYKSFIEKEAREFKAYNPYRLSKYFLENAYRSWEGFDNKLVDWQSEVNSEVVSSEDKINALDKTKQIWELTLVDDRLNDEPEELKSSIREIIGQTRNLKIKLQKQKTQLLILEDDITELSTFCNDIIIEINSLQQHLRDSLFIAVSPPIWKVKVSQSDYIPVGTRLYKFRHDNGKTLRNYFENVSLFSFWILVVFIGLSFFLLRRSYLNMNLDNSDPGYKNFSRIFLSYPLLTFITLVMITFLLLFPYQPLIIGHVFTLIMLINMRFILSNFLDKEGRSFVTKVIILLVINDLEIIFWYFGNVSRFYILLETMTGIVLMVSYLRPIYWHNFKSIDLINKSKWILAMIVLSFYFIAFLSNLFGFVNLSVLFLRAGSHVPEFTILLLGIYKINETLIMSLSRLVHVRKNTFLDKYMDIIEKRVIQATKIFIVYYWFFSWGVSFEISRVIYDSVAEFLMKERVIGTLVITISGIISFALILIITFIITGILKILIEELILKRSKLPRGIPAAISVTIRYFLIILGFTFAMSAAGIELGKFSLLAGALGVGIGFGLQNIVNNFISGIIIVYERPLQVGDTIEVENLLGQVNRIGIRSSNVRTYDGAEVVVPNGNLISNQLINWTLSDNKRRIEIKVGVSYSSDPNIVIDLLEKVAKENNNTMKDPPPVALFEDFGDSSLNFRLLFWVPYDIGIGTKSAVAVGVYNKFKEHKIEIPFPQLDLHVKKEEEGKG